VHEYKLGSLMIGKGAQAVATGPDSLSMSDAVRLIVEGDRLRRMGLNMPTEIQQQQVTGTHVLAQVGGEQEALIQDPEVAAAVHEALRVIAAKRQSVSIQMPPAPSPSLSIQASSDEGQDDEAEAAERRRKREIAERIEAAKQKAASRDREVTARTTD
jgi:hypothetical protein